MSDLCKLYMERITCLGADISFRVNSFRPKDRVVFNFPHLNAYKQGREHILAFKDDIGPTLKRVGSIHHFLHLRIPVPSKAYDSCCPFV